MTCFSSSGYDILDISKKNRDIGAKGEYRMKFTEGYWLPSEKANASYAMQAYEVEKIPGGMRVLATTKKIVDRGATLNLPTITIEFVAHTPDTISMEAWHYEAYDNNVPSFEKEEGIYENSGCRNWLCWIIFSHTIKSR